MAWLAKEAMAAMVGGLIARAQAKYAVLTSTAISSLNLREPAMSAPKKRSYHHGNLRQALIDMAVRLAEERGHEELSLREVATLRLRLLVERDQRAAPADPLARIHALGHSFIDWALDQPAQFRRGVGVRRCAWIRSR